MDAWGRILIVKFISKTVKKQMVFGNNFINGQEDLSIDVSIHKEMSPLSDSATIRLKNLTYKEIIQLINGKYYDVEVWAGYRTYGAQRVYKGNVIYISNSLDNRKSNTAIILCGSELVARYGQRRLNVSINSGINLYSALNYVCKKAQIPNSNISPQFKKKFVQDILTVDQTVGSFFKTLTDSNSSFIINSDSSANNSAINLFNANESDNRIIKLTDKTINLIGGTPQLNKDGLNISVIPTYSFMCGDTIQLDNSLIDISVSNRSEINQNKAYYLDKDGCYMIYNMDYHLQNRGSEFSINIIAKTRSLVSSIFK